MLKKCVIVLALAGLVVSGSVIGCAKKEAPVQPPVQPILWTFHSLGGGPTSTSAQAEEDMWFINQVKERSGGRLIIEPYWACSLAKPGTIFRVVGEGEVDIAEAWWTISSSEVPWLGALDHYAPTQGILETRAVMDALLPLIQETADEHGVYILASWSFLGNREDSGMFFWVKDREIKTVDDCKGLVCRVFSALSTAAMVEPLGMKPVLIPAGEVAMAMKTGVCDAVFTGFAAGIDYGAADFSKYAYRITRGICCVPISLVVDKDAFDALPSDVQQIMREVGKELEQRSWGIAANPKAFGYLNWEESIELAASKGCEIRSLPEAVMDQVQENALDHLLNVWLPQADERGKEATELILTTVEQIRGVKFSR